MRTRQGFTFVELLTAMVVIGALSAMAVPRFRTYKERAYVSAMRSDLANIRIAEEAYWAEHLHYATDTAALDFRPTSSVRIAVTTRDIVGGFTAIATHDNLPGQQCVTYVGKDAIGVPSGETMCDRAPPGAGTLRGPIP